ncbi:SDR family oxidoreductase [Salinispora arenicola]|uniref:SDR family oxidoreductase n=1 Tax=Salinispora arenicola TaxID=168697 RepID=UPI00035FCED4|nr:SDR family oxidoreductase [Salinispora arenicola]
MRLKGKTVLITGAARGLGRDCALRFAEEGADLVLLDVCRDIDDIPYPLGSRAQLDHTAEQCERAAAAVVAVTANVQDEAECGAAVAAALDRFGRLDVLVNNAGIAAPSGKLVEDITEREWSLMLDIDLSGAWRMMKAALPTMAAQRSGSIVNVASTAGLVGYRRFAGYVAAKHGLIGLTKAAALDYAPVRVRVNALCPGSVHDDPVREGRMLSEIARSLDVSVAEHETIFVRDQPMNMLINPSDISNAALWLAGDESRQVTGTVLTVDGGFTTR